MSKHVWKRYELREGEVYDDRYSYYPQQGEHSYAMGSGTGYEYQGEIYTGRSFATRWEFDEEHGFRVTGSQELSTDNALYAIYDNDLCRVTVTSVNGTEFEIRGRVIYYQEARKEYFTVYRKGEYLGKMTSADRKAYPKEGAQGGYYWVYDGVFSGATQFVKSGGIWKQAMMYVKMNGVWRLCQAYKRADGVWRV